MKASATLSLYATAEYPCSYLDGKTARSQVATPVSHIDADIYSELVKQGFRRSGDITYRPYCNHCNACVPARIPVNDFDPNRSQQRAWRRHEQLVAKEKPLVLNHEHFDLYQLYLSQRHPNGGMDKDTVENYQQFLLTTHVNTRLIEFSENNKVVMVSIVDVLNDGLSSVYTFFRPDQTSGQKSSFGIYNILWQIVLCRTLGLPYLYLGYWVKGSPKMDYKANFKPLEGLKNYEWVTL
jgi:leucyl-tRNA---protein transferase